VVLERISLKFKIKILGRRKMKKLILISLMMLLGLPLAAYSAPVDGPPTQGFNISLGQDYTNFRDLKPTPVAISTGPQPDCNIRHMYRTMLKVGYGFFDFLEVYIKLGGAGYRFRADVEDLSGFPSGNAVVHTRMGFAYGVGVKAAYEFKDGPVRGLLIGADAQYLRQRNRYHAMLMDDVGPDSDSGNVTLQEWQFGPFVGYRIMKLLPYVGVKYSDVRLKFSGGGENTKFRAEDHFGVFAGLTYDILPRKVSLNLEGRFIDETGVNFNLIYKFK
jgi:opacity protein-like surface antigen